MGLNAAIALAAAAVLAYVIVDDLRNYRIKNSVIIVLFCLCIANLLAKPEPTPLFANLIFAVLIFGILFLAYIRRLVGGGDVKLLALAYLWIGPQSALFYSIILLLLTILYWAGARFHLLPSQNVGRRLKIPFGPSIAGAWILALIGLALEKAS